MSRRKIKVLSLGHLPKQYGGRQTSGLAMAVFELADAINRTANDIEVILSCTDWFEENGKVRDTNVIGWRPKILLRHFLSHPFRSCYYCIMAIALAVPYKQPILRNIGYFVFYDYCIEKTRADVLHLDGEWRALLGHYILKPARIKTVVKIHGMTGHDPNISNYKKWHKVERRITELRFHGIVFVCEHLLRDWEAKYGKPLAPVIAILNGIDFNIFHPTDSTKKKDGGKLRLLTVGAISEQKGQRRVVRAIAKLDDPSRVEYTCIGGGDSEDVKELIDEARRNSVDFNYIDYTTQPDLIKYVRQADFMILPSTSEGFGMVFIESIAVGTPVIIPKHLPIVYEKGLINQNNAIFIEDSCEEAICQGIQKAFSLRFDPSEVAGTVKHLSWELTASEYCEIFRRLF